MFPTGGILGIMVLMAFGADPTADPDTWTWTQVSGVQYEQSISITRGRGDEQTVVQPAMCQFRILNPNGKFSARNVAGPYYRQLGLNTPVRVMVNPGTGWHIRFTGLWNRSAPRRDVTGNYRWIPVVAQGPLKRFTEGDAPLVPALRRTLTGANATVLPVGIWEMNESGAATYGDVPPFELAATFTTGAVQWGQGDLGRSLFAGARVTGLTILRSSVVLASTPTDLAIDVMRRASVPDNTSDGTLGWDHVSTDGSNIFDYYIDMDYNSGTPTLKLWRQNGAVTLLDTGASADAEAAWDGSMHVWRLRATQNGADVDLEGFLDGVSVLTATHAGVTLTKTPRLDLYQYPTEASYAVVQWVDDIASASSVYNAAAGYPDDDAHIRFARICAEESAAVDVPTATIGQPMGIQEPDATLNLLRGCAQVAESTIVERFDGRLGLDPISLRYNQSKTMSIDWSAAEILGTPEPTDDDALIRNQIRITRAGGISVTATDTTGPLGTSNRGTYLSDKTLSLSSDSLATQHANWRLAIGTIDAQRWPDLTVHLTEQPQLITPWLAMDIGKTYEIVNPDVTDAGPDPIGQILEGYTERFDQIQWTIKPNGVPSQVVDSIGVMQLPSATPGPTEAVRSDTAGSTTAAGTSFVCGTSTSLTVDIDAGPLWGVDADTRMVFPFDIVVAGIVLRVTGIAGAATPQTFTISTTLPLDVGSGVVIGAGEAVNLAYPARYGL